jgi:hypothetical protein
MDSGEIFREGSLEGPRADEQATRVNEAVRATLSPHTVFLSQRLPSVALGGPGIWTQQAGGRERAVDSTRI